jgi:hypothetical protein
MFNKTIKRSLLNDQRVGSLKQYILKHFQGSRHSSILSGQGGYILKFRAGQKVGCEEA